MAEDDADNVLTIQPLFGAVPSYFDRITRDRGAGQEVGRSCHILKFKGKTIMVRCAPLS